MLKILYRQSHGSLLFIGCHLREGRGLIYLRMDARLRISGMTNKAADCANNFGRH